MSSFRYLLLAFILLLLPAPVRSDFPPPQAPQVPRDGPIVLKSGEHIAVGFEIKHGKMVNFVGLVWGTERKENVLHISLTREGGLRTKLGTKTPITERLTIQSSEKRSIAVRAEYTRIGTDKSLGTRVKAREGFVNKSFQWGLTQVALSEFELPNP